MTLTLSKQQARHLILHLQGLTLPHHKALGFDGSKELIRQLGFVQVDSIQWLERAHHMILQTRSQAYRPKHLKRLHEKEKFLFEGWTHDASFIPTEFFPYWRHRFERTVPRLERKFSAWQGDGYLKHCDDLLKRISDEGPLRARDLEKPDTGKQEMWQWHDGKAALEFLWHTGQLCIIGRDGFQKIYCLAENGIPEEHFRRRVSHEEFIDWACSTALDRLGFGTPGDIARFWDLVTIREAGEWAERQDEQRVRNIAVRDGKKKRPFLARADIEDVLDTLPDLPTRIRALSPFDPVIRDRKRLEWLFGFDYRIEIYVPAEKRKWGYYIFPLLEGSKLIGRIDMRADRKANALEARRVWLESKIRWSNARQSRLESELQRQARFAGLGDVAWLEGSSTLLPGGEKDKQTR